MERKQWFGTVAAQIGRNALALVAFWVIGFAFIRAAHYVADGWRTADVAQLIACVVAALLALRLRAQVAALLIAAQVAFTASELTMHSAYSIRVVQGAPAHFAVMMAATLGVLLGALLLALMMRPATTTRTS